MGAAWPERNCAASWGFAPPAPTRLRRFARASRSHPASPGAMPLGLRPHPISRPPEGAEWCPLSRLHRPGQEQAASVRHHRKVWQKKTGRRLRLEQAAQVCRRSPIPPAPSRWEGERVALCRQGCRLRGASLASPAPPPWGLGRSKGVKGRASPSPSRPVSSLRCGPRQPGFRPLTPFPLKNQRNPPR